MKREGKDNAIDSGSYDDIGAAMQMQNPSYADPTSAIWAWNLVGYIACICCLWNSNYVEPHRHSKRSYNSALGRCLSLSVRSERWKVRYPPPQVCLYLQCNPLANWYDSKNQQTHTLTTNTHTDKGREDALETLLFCLLSGVPCEGDLLPICAENRKWFVRIYR